MPRTGSTATAGDARASCPVAGVAGNVAGSWWGAVEPFRAGRIGGSGQRFWEGRAPWHRKARSQEGDFSSDGPLLRRTAPERRQVKAALRVRVLVLRRQALGWEAKPKQRRGGARVMGCAHGLARCHRAPKRLPVTQIKAIRFHRSAFVVCCMDRMTLCVATASGAQSTANAKGETCGRPTPGPEHKRHSGSCPLAKRWAAGAAIRGCRVISSR